MYETSSRTTRYISILKENVDIFLKHLKFELNVHIDIDVSVKIFCCLTCYKSFNSFCRSDIGEEVMFQAFQYINTCLHTDPSKCINDQTLRSDTEFCRTSLLELSDKCPTKSSQVGVRVSTLR